MAPVVVRRRVGPHCAAPRWAGAAGPEGPGGPGCELSSPCRARFRCRSAARSWRATTRGRRWGRSPPRWGCRCGRCAPSGGGGAIAGRPGCGRRPTAAGHRARAPMPGSCAPPAGCGGAPAVGGAPDPGDPGRALSRVALPHPRTVERWFRARGLRPPAPPPRPPVPPRATHPHAVWPLDAKEQVRLADGTQVSWLTITDEASGAILDEARGFPPARGAGRAAGGPRRAGRRSSRGRGCRGSGASTTGPPGAPSTPAAGAGALGDRVGVAVQWNHPAAARRTAWSSAATACWPLGRTGCRPRRGGGAGAADRRRDPPTGAPAWHPGRRPAAVLRRRAPRRGATRRRRSAPARMDVRRVWAVAGGSPPPPPGRQGRAHLGLWPQARGGARRRRPDRHPRVRPDPACLDRPRRERSPARPPPGPRTDPRSAPGARSRHPHTRRRAHLAAADRGG